MRQSVDPQPYKSLPPPQSEMSRFEMAWFKKVSTIRLAMHGNSPFNSALVTHSQSPDWKREITIIIITIIVHSVAACTENFLQRPILFVG
jgi:hypothetical protein